MSSSSELTSQQIKLAILEYLNGKYGGDYKYNIIGRVDAPVGAIEHLVDDRFNSEQRHLASRCFDELRSADLIRSTYSSNAEPENWVAITDAGRAALKSGSIEPKNHVPQEQGGEAASTPLSPTNSRQEKVSPAEVVTYSLPEIRLTEPELLWLRELYKCFKNHEDVDVKALKVKLRGKIPADFEPKNIDGRLLYGYHITLYGIWHVDPNTNLLHGTDLVIRAIRQLIFDDTKRETVTSEEVADLTQLPQPEVEFLIQHIRLLGFFWSELVHVSSAGYSEVKVNDGEVFNEYYRYEGIEKLFIDLNARSEALSYQVNSPNNKRNVFVVHGRNQEARNSLFRFLRSIGLRPIEWSQAVTETGKASPFIGEILDVAFSVAQAVVVLMTPDDVAQLREPFRSASDQPYESQLTGQARPNVLFEAGMAMGRNPDRTIIVELGTLRPFSDIAGRHTVRLSNDSAARQELAQRLETAGCPVELTGRDWHTEGNFASQTLPLIASEPLPNVPNQPDGHDQQLFAKLLSDLPSQSQSIRFLRDHDSGASFPSKWLDPLVEFIHQWNDAEHEFNNSELEKKRLEFWKTLNTFLRELGKYTSSTQRDGWLSIGLEDMDDRPEMLEAHARLNDLGTVAYKAHQNLVREGKRLGLSVNEPEVPALSKYRGTMEGTN